MRPGDVVLNELAPVRAAFVSPAAKRHPVDGNSLIVRDLSHAEAVWVAPVYSTTLEEQTLKEGSPERNALLAEHERVRSLLLSNLTEVFPYFVPGVLWMLAIAAVLCVIWVAVQRGY